MFLPNGPRGYETQRATEGCKLAAWLTKQGKLDALIRIIKSFSRFQACTYNDTPFKRQG